MSLTIRQFAPARELECLCRCAGVDYALERAAYPAVESTGELPQVEHGAVLVGGERALDYVRGLCALEAQLTPLDAALAAGLLPLVQCTLGDVERWAAHAGGAGAERVLRDAPAPFSFLMARALHVAQNARLLRQGLVTAEAAQARAEPAYRALEAVLRANREKRGGPFFFGARCVRARGRAPSASTRALASRLLWRLPLPTHPPPQKKFRPPNLLCAAPARSTPPCSAT